MQLPKHFELLHSDFLGRLLRDRDDPREFEVVDAWQLEDGPLVIRTAFPINGIVPTWREASIREIIEIIRSQEGQEEIQENADAQIHNCLHLPSVPFEAIAKEDRAARSSSHKPNPTLGLIPPIPRYWLYPEVESPPSLPLVPADAEGMLTTPSTSRLWGFSGSQPKDPSDVFVGWVGFYLPDDSQTIKRLRERQARLLCGDWPVGRATERLASENDSLTTPAGLWVHKDHADIVKGAMQLSSLAEHVKRSPATVLASQFVRVGPSLVNDRPEESLATIAKHNATDGREATPSTPDEKVHERAIVGNTSDGPFAPSGFRWKGNAVEGFTPKQCELLKTVFANRDDPLTVHELKDELWPWPKSYSGRGAYDKTASNINKKLRTIGAELKLDNGYSVIRDLTIPVTKQSDSTP